MSIQGILEYITSTFIVAGSCFIGIIGIRNFYNLKTKKVCLNKRRQLVLDFFILYMLSLYQITAIRYGLGLCRQRMFFRYGRINLLPMEFVVRWVIKGRWWHLVYNVVGNCIWFVPFGFFVPALFKDKRKMYKVMYLGALTSISIEFLQMFLRTGVTDIDDVIFNTLGAVMGYGIWKILYKIRNKGGSMH